MSYEENELDVEC